MNDKPFIAGSPNFSPLHLQILLHYHCSPEPFQPVSAASHEYAAQLIEDGLIHHQGGELRTTERGKAHIRQLETLPLPVLKWADAQGRIIA